jgi:N-acetylornithine carbamoyltransferase
MSNGTCGDTMVSLDGIKSELFGRDFLHTWKQSDDDLRAVVTVAEALEKRYRAGESARVFNSGLAISIFRDQSTRTRFSFAGAANLLGLGLQELDEEKSQIAHGETVRETANMISFLTETIGIRDDMFLGEGHKYMVEVADAVQEGFDNGVLAQRPSVINLQCDLDHPTQSMADLLHLKQMFGSLDALRGKRIAMTWAYSPSYGKPLSVPQGIITLMTRFGMDVVLAHPEGYDLVPETVETSKRFATESGGSFRVSHNMADAFTDADIVYPKSWASYRVMQERTRLLRADESAKLGELEKQCLADNAKHQDWECNDKLMSVTRDGRAAYMHCLPADISGVSCKNGEVAANVFERARLDTYREASHKPFIIAAMMLLTRFEDPAATLSGLADRRRL